MMSSMELKILISGLAALDIAIIVVFLLFVRKIRSIRQRVSLEQEITLFESLVVDSEKTASRFKAQLEAKHQLIQSLNAKLDKRISGLNLLLNRADAMLSTYSGEEEDREGHAADAGPQHERVLSLARTGCSAETVAEKLSIPVGEVRLLLDLNDKIARLRDGGGGS